MAALAPPIEEGFDVDLSFAATTFSDDSGDGDAEGPSEIETEPATTRPRSRHVGGQDANNTTSRFNPNLAAPMTPLLHPLHRADTDSPSLDGRSSYSLHSLSLESLSVASPSSEAGTPSSFRSRARSKSRARLPGSSVSARPHQHQEPPSKPSAVSATLVLKNLPFNLIPAVLEAKLASISITATPSRTELREKGGTFSGMAFAVYTSVESATEAYDGLSGLTVDGRKIEVEYKRSSSGNSNGSDERAKSPEQTVTSSSITQHLQQFKDGSETVLEFPNCNSSQRKLIHSTAQLLGLRSSTATSRGQRFVRVAKDGDVDLSLSTSTPPFDLGTGGTPRLASLHTPHSLGDSSFELLLPNTAPTYSSLSSRGSDRSRSTNTTSAARHLYFPGGSHGSHGSQNGLAAGNRPRTFSAGHATRLRADSGRSTPPFLRQPKGPGRGGRGFSSVEGRARTLSTGAPIKPELVYRARTSTVSDRVIPTPAFGPGPVLTPPTPA